MHLFVSGHVVAVRIFVSTQPQNKSIRTASVQQLKVHNSTALQHIKAIHNACETTRLCRVQQLNHMSDHYQCIPDIALAHSTPAASHGP